jgi:predicted AlkP superfamily pyrophosphatase or phosphodiesterase
MDNILNLTASIKNNFGVKDRFSIIKDLSLKKKLFLVIIDGLGISFLKTQKNSFILKNLKATLKTVFPTTTPAALTSLYTGLPPSSHGLIGAYLYHKQSNCIFHSQKNTKVSDNKPIDFDINLAKTNLFQELPIKSYSFYPEIYAKNKTLYNQMLQKGSEEKPYQDLKDLEENLKKTNFEKESFSIIYFDKYDSLSHQFGPFSQESIKHFKLIDNFLKRLSKTLKSDEQILISADHGFIKTGGKQILDLQDYPDLLECLKIPLSGEPRIAYFHIKDNFKEKFLKIHQNKLNKYFKLIPQKEALKLYGAPPYHSQLRERIGDFLGIMQSNYMINDSKFLPLPPLLGMHGGENLEEYEVPLGVV